MSGQRPSEKQDDSLDSFLAGQAAKSAPDEQNLQQLHQYAKAHPPARNVATGIGIGVVIMLFAVRIAIKMMQQN